MTVLHVISGLGIGGAETMLVQVATGLRSRGIPQHVVSLTGRGESGSRLEAAGIVPSYFDFRARLQAPRLLFNLIALVGTLRPTVIQGWMYHGDVMATLAHHLAPGRAQRRLFWNLRAADMDQERYSRIIRWAARLSRRPDIVIANSEAGARAHAEFGYRPRRFEIIPNGIDTEKFRPDSRISVSDAR